MFKRWKRTEYMSKRELVESQVPGSNVIQQITWKFRKVEGDCGRLLECFEVVMGLDWRRDEQRETRVTDLLSVSEWWSWGKIKHCRLKFTHGSWWVFTGLWEDVNRSLEWNQEESLRCKRGLVEMRVTFWVPSFFLREGGSLDGWTYVDLSVRVVRKSDDNTVGTGTMIDL